jgi:magnesium chelatase family protein
VEVHLANGLPSFTVVGLADTEVKEARERVRAALQNSGLSFPANKRIKCSQALFSKSVSGKTMTMTVRAS